MAYNRIDGIPEGTKFSFPELKSLKDVWDEKRDELEGTPAFSEFLNRLKREWAIETGIIERLYAWDRGVTQALIEQGIESALIAHKAGLSGAEAAHTQKIIEDQLDVIEWLFAFVRGDEPLTEHFIRSLQAKFTANQDFTDAITPEGRSISIPLLKGEYKSQPNNPKRPDGTMHEYCPPELVNDEMQQLVRIYRGAEQSADPVVLAAWLHHRFTQIHPFQDGNGRVARALATLVFLRAGMLPIVVRDSDRVAYIDALEQADDGDLFLLCKLFAKRQRESMLNVLGLSREAQKDQYADEIIASALRVLQDRFSRETVNVQKVFKYAARLKEMASERFERMAGELDGRLQTLTPPNYDGEYYARRTVSGEATRHYFYGQIIQMAKEWDYFANLNGKQEWVRLSIRAEPEFEYVLSLHGVGQRDTGVMVVSPFTYLRIQKEDGGHEFADVHSAATELFQFNYAESIDSVEQRFADWLDMSVAIALGEWKRTLQ